MALHLGGLCKLFRWNGRDVWAQMLGNKGQARSKVKETGWNGNGFPGWWRRNMSSTACRILLEHLSSKGCHLLGGPHLHLKEHELLPHLPWFNLGTAGICAMAPSISAEQIQGSGACIQLLLVKDQKTILLPQNYSPRAKAKGFTGKQRREQESDISFTGGMNTFWALASVKPNLHIHALLVER